MIAGELSRVPAMAVAASRDRPETAHRRLAGHVLSPLQVIFPSASETLMPMPDHAYALRCHPATPAATVSGISAEVARTPAGDFVFSYRLSGDMVRLRIPSPHAPSRADGLWQHTCFEAFVALAGSDAYREFNFSPSGQWAAYAFAAYRRPVAAHAAPTMAAAPRIEARLFAGHLDLTAIVPALALPAEAVEEPLQIGLAAVVESADTVDGERSYWALQHPAGRPDFHHREAFAIDLPACRQNF
jgi:hypothetical protein